MPSGSKRRHIGCPFIADMTYNDLKQHSRYIFSYDRLVVECKISWLVRACTMEWHQPFSYTCHVCFMFNWRREKKEREDYLSLSLI
jgi:hypothetical protein